MREGNPTVIVYNPNNPAMHADPYPIYERLREEAPLYHHGTSPHYWALSRHADVSAAWRDFELFSNAYGVAIEQWGPDARKAMSFIAMDPPEHDRMRALISRAFTPARVQQMRERIVEITRSYLEPALEMGTFDFVDDFATMIPVDVISDLIGVPRADRPMLTRLSQQIMERDDAHGQLTVAVREANMQLARYYHALIDERRRHPGEDLASALLQAEIDGDRLSDGDVAAALMLLGVAGNETTIKLIANAWRLAFQHPDQRERAFADVQAWVEETLRLEGPSQYTARLVTREVELHGQLVPAGSMLLLVIAAANRDERVFPDAERFILDRDTSQTLAFGLGRHFCLGAALARLEARVVFGELVARVEPTYEVDIDQALWAQSPNVRGHRRLPTTIKARRRA